MEAVAVEVGVEGAAEAIFMVAITALALAATTDITGARAPIPTIVVTMIFRMTGEILQRLTWIGNGLKIA